ncbi:MAG TPA: methyltransferase domain-containing protein [Steroidobacteraceae bacterium]|nr:methyltransferase domain-containing protein [Steroidobacteraceae bacterium]
MPTPASRRLPVLALLALGALASAALRADIYEEAVAHAGRPDKDVQRDALDHPAEVLRLAGIKPGMKVGDIMGGTGYYAELLSYLVGPTGHVYILNNEAFDTWSEGRWKSRTERLKNVEHRTEDLEHLDLPNGSLDAVLLIKVYHDLYWVDDDPADHWPKYDVKRVLDEVARVLKPGGVLLLVDHSAKAGSGSADAGSLHRIDEAFAQQDFERHGFKLLGKSDVLRHPDDARDQITYKGPMLGKTDRFVLVLRKS